MRVAATAQDAARSETAAFELQGDADRGELRLSTPLGSQVAVATWAPDVALLTTPGSRSRFGSLAELARQAFGEDLPLQAMPEWLRGRPWANSRSTNIEGGFTQLGWRVDLTRFAEGVLVAVRDAAPAVTLRVQIDR